jgi:hypothetical protein
MAGAVGNAIIFFFSLIGLVVCMLYFLGYAANCLLVVLQGTSSGQDEVTWADEPVFDWLPRALHIVAVGLILLAPAGIVARSLRHNFLPDQPLLRFALLAGPLFWLGFPICVLSALAGLERWVIVRWRVIANLLRMFFSTLAFYFLTALILIAVGFSWYGALLVQPFLLPVACLATGAGVLIYSRLLGRIGWLIAQREPVKPERSSPSQGPRAKGKSKPPGQRRRKGPLREVQVEDPWAVPESESIPEPPPGRRPSYLPPPVHEQERYGVADEDAPRPGPRPKRRGRFEPETPYDVEAYQVGPEPPVRPPIIAPPDPPSSPSTEPDEDAEEKPASGRISAYDRRLLEPTAPPYEPPIPLFSGVWTFPFYSTCHAPWFRLALWSFLAGLMMLSMLGHFDGLGV